MKLLMHKLIVYLKDRLYKYPNVRRSACIHPLVRLQKDTVVGKWSQINGPTSIGKNVFIGRNVHICEPITIGDNVTIGHLSQLVTGDTGLDGFNPVTQNCDKVSPIVIEDDVFINHSVTISSAGFKKKVTLGKGCIIMMGASVFESVPAYAVMQGNPAKLIGYVEEKNRRQAIE